MSDGRTKFAITLSNEALHAVEHKVNAPTAQYMMVATVLVEHAEDARCFADYLWARVLETYQHLLVNFAGDEQLLRGLVRRFVHITYPDNPAIQAYPLVPEFLSDAGETKEDDSE